MNETKDVLVPITGRRGSGKDTIARIGIAKYGCVGSVALSTWFKKLLSDVFKVPLADFYSSKKDEKLATPLVLTVNSMRKLKSAMSMQSGPKIDIRIARIAIGSWEGRQVESLRDLMVWFGHEFVTLRLGNDFHNGMTEKAIQELPRHPDGFNVIFVTDARQFPQSNYYNLNYKHCYPIRIVRPDGSADVSAPEKETEQFPPGYFFAEIVNDGSFEDLEEKVRKVMLDIRVDLKEKVYGFKTVEVVPALVVKVEPIREVAPPAEEEYVRTTSYGGTGTPHFSVVTAPPSDIADVVEVVGLEISVDEKSGLSFTSDGKCAVPAHSRYTGARTPRSDCQNCWAIYNAKKQEYNAPVKEASTAHQVSTQANSTKETTNDDSK